MLNSQLAKDNTPYERLRRYRILIRHFIKNFGVIHILLVLILMLCINNVMVTKSYNEIKSMVDTAARKFDEAETEKSLLLKERESLESKNASILHNNEKIIKQNREFLKEIHSLRELNDRLLRKNQELVEDNIALQNSLKIAASAGIKPQNYTEFKGLSFRGEIDRGKYIGRFLGTSYTPCKEECGNDRGITNSGKPIIPGISIAVDTDYWPFGTIFYIKGLGYAVAMDTGSAIKGKYRFDFAVFDRSFAKKLGSRKWDVYLVKLGNGSVGNEVEF
ncbi:MAG: 3D domain-containing protein [Acetivibrionales bacterium]|jgi:3D (Asp-Asp-Asp) domain-containing protein